MIPRRRRASVPNALQGSVTTVDVTASGGVAARKSRDDSWQKEAWATFHDLGEVRFCARYVGNMLARCQFYVGTRESPGSPLVPIPDDATGDDAIMRDQLERIKGRDGTFASLVRMFGIQQFVSGESYLVAEEGLEGERWEILSTSEMRRIEKKTPSGGKVVDDPYQATGPQFEKVSPDGTVIEISPSSVVLRLYQRDPEFRQRADSPLRPVLDLCEALRVAQLMQTAGDRSRLASSGVWLIPTGANLPKTEQNNLNGPLKQPARLELLDQIMEAVNAVMANPGSPQAIIPVMVEVDDKFIQSMHLGPVRFDREVDKTISLRIDHLIRRLAQALDIPPEVLLGLGDLNHWSAWQVAEATIGAHIMPMGENFCEDLVFGFLRPSADLLKIQDLDKYGIGCDPTVLIVAPDKADHAFKLYDRFELSAEYLLEATGFDESMIPELDEIIKRIEIARAVNIRNPDPGADIAALEGKAPPPTGQEKPVAGDPNKTINPRVAEPSPDSAPDGQAQPGTPPQEKPTSGAPTQASLLDRVMLAVIATVEQGVRAQVAGEPAGDWMTLEGQILGMIGDSDAAEKLVDVARAVARARVVGTATDWKETLGMACAAALFHDEDDT